MMLPIQGKKTMMTSGDSFSLLPEKWKELLEKNIDASFFYKLMKKVEREYETKTVYPPRSSLFRAFDSLLPSQVKVVLLGQDPYHEKGQANGLAFSVQEGTPFPRSLTNIFKELQYEYGYMIPRRNGDLSSWAKQGVLLLNTTLSVEEGKANSHAKLGWQTFTDGVISSLDSLDQTIVYLLWGNDAFSKASLIQNPKARIIHTVHPSPLSASRGFFHSDCFKKVNQALKEANLSEIDWEISDFASTMFSD